MDKEGFFNPNLKTRLLKLEEEFKKNNPLGYQQRNSLSKEVEKQEFYVFHEMSNIERETRFCIQINKYEWLLFCAYKNPSDVYHANDVTRLQYIEAAEEVGFMGYLPQQVILFAISNKDTLEKLDEISNEDLAVVFPTTIHGKRIKYLFNDFGLIIKNINFKKENNGNWNKRTIIIDTGILTD